MDLFATQSYLISILETTAADLSIIISEICDMKELSVGYDFLIVLKSDAHDAVVETILGFKNDHWRAPSCVATLVGESRKSLPMY